MHGLYESFKEGGWGMWPIVLWSILTIAVIVERAIFLYSSTINKDVFLATMQKCILAGDVAKAVKMMAIGTPKKLAQMWAKNHWIEKTTPAPPPVGVRRENIPNR